MADEEGKCLEKGALIPDKPCVKYEYLDHTADVQLHAWGGSLQEAFEQVVVSMFGYITDLNLVEMTRVHRVRVEADDLHNLLYHFLDEFLYLFSVEPFHTCRVVKVINYERIAIGDNCEDGFLIEAEGYGESFDLAKHTQGAEVKAITYSNMQIHQPVKGDNKKTDWHVFVIIDI